MNLEAQQSMSLAGEPPKAMSTSQKLAVALGVSGLFLLVLGGMNISMPNKWTFLGLSLGLISIGILWFTYDLYKNTSPGIKNNGIYFKSMTSKGLPAWITGIVLTLFYIVLYWFPEMLGYNPEGENWGVVALFDPLSKLLSGNAASHWFMYGTLYTLAILLFGIKFIWKYRHNRYELIRTISVMFFQLAFAFLIPQLLMLLNKPYYDFKNIWPLNYDLFFDYKLDEYLSAGTIGTAMLIFGILSIFVITPILTYKYGKRWYCSWVCGCGGLAETAGDSYRQLSDKRLSAWKIERWVVHSVVVFVTVMTIAVVYSYLDEKESAVWLNKHTFIWLVFALLTAVFSWVMLFRKDQLAKDAKRGAVAYFAIVISLLLISYFGNKPIYFLDPNFIRYLYGFIIGSIFSGVIGVGFYPIFGNRVWCRFGCPMAAILGFQQRLFSRFRITVNGGQCISCGNCSTYCEMGIDVRAYAQKGENIVRSSCVGCGVCSAVCPRGVLKLENDSTKNRINANEVLLGNAVNLMDYVNQK